LRLRAFVANGMRERVSLVDRSKGRGRGQEPPLIDSDASTPGALREEVAVLVGLPDARENVLRGHGCLPAPALHRSKPHDDPDDERSHGNERSYGENDQLAGHHAPVRRPFAPSTGSGLACTSAPCPQAEDDAGRDSQQPAEYGRGKDDPHE
jgi:hypothetical protein